ncbi:MAG: hypothetical protein JSV84_03335 [Gemmatimonadota bacterium]|nr:MAG: hypothetical protein JSV84_03335 [Gemmatimonadota bacterium]
MKKIHFLKSSDQIFLGMCVSVTIVFILLFAVGAVARINLPQLSDTLQVAKEDQDRLINYFEGFEGYSDIEIEKDVEKILLNALKGIYDSACSEMISYWGTVAEGTATLTVRVVFIHTDTVSTKRGVLFTIKCHSKYKEYGEKYCDERLAVLSTAPGNASIILLPHAEDCKNCSELSSIKFEQIVQRNPLIIVLSIRTTNDNPCCGGAYAYSDEKVYYYAFLESGIKQVASVVRYRSEYSHDDVEGDYSKIYESKIRYASDPTGSSTRIISEYVITTNGVEEGSGTQSYFWNSENEEFEIMQK